MELLEKIGGVVLIIVSVLLIILCLSQEQKSQDSMSAALTGASTDSFYGKNEGRTKEAILSKITRTLGIIMFAIVLAINIIPVLSK
ncbi:MAG: preprotein translocase subunit SecG [Ruminococcus sp.]|nr:preprotein translocase subunit SecG [Ruminococcus sp.]